MSHGELDQLKQRIRRLSAEQPFGLHWQLRLIGTGEVIGSSADTVVGSFSTRKVSILLACLALARRGELALDQQQVVTEQMHHGVQAGVMRTLSPGIRLSLSDSLRQMMCTSDNICTQLVFEAIGAATGDSLQWVNDYCAWSGMTSTVHREIFPRSAELGWNHSLEAMTVTTAADQALLLEQLGAGCTDSAAAERLQLTVGQCQFAVEAMQGIYTPVFGRSTRRLRFAEKNGRGLRGLSQVGLALGGDGKPVAALAAFAEPVPTALPSGLPGRAAVSDLFARIGVAVEEWSDDRKS